jgi:hypothetical protein
MAWRDMIKFSQRLIYACRPGYDPMSINGALFREEDVDCNIPVQDKRLMDEMTESD